MKALEYSFRTIMVKTTVLLFFISFCIPEVLSAQDFLEQIKRMFANKKEIDVTYHNPSLGDINEYYWISGDSLYRISYEGRTHIVYLKDIDYKASEVIEESFLEQHGTGKPTYRVSLKVFDGKDVFFLVDRNTRDPQESYLHLTFNTPEMANQVFAYLAKRTGYSGPLSLGDFGNDVSSESSSSNVPEARQKSAEPEISFDIKTFKDSIRICVWDNDCGYYKGEMAGGKANGRGILIASTGLRYTGFFVNNKMNGQGTVVLATGDKYTGMFKDDDFDGQGTIVWTTGNTYTGEWKACMMDGQGTMIWKNGDKYVGQWKEGKANGYGTKTVVGGNTYVGMFKNSMANGYGTCTFAGGGKFEGEWVNDKICGKGKLTKPDGSSTEGIFGK